MKFKFARISSLAIATSLLTGGALAQAQSVDIDNRLFVLERDVSSLDEFTDEVEDRVDDLEDVVYGDRPASSDGIFANLEGDIEDAKDAVTPLTAPVTEARDRLAARVGIAEALRRTLRDSDVALFNSFDDARRAEDVALEELNVAGNVQLRAAGQRTTANNDLILATAEKDATAGDIVNETNLRNSARTVLNSRLAEPFPDADAIVLAQNNLTAAERRLADAVAADTTAATRLAVATAARNTAEQNVLAAARVVVQKNDAFATAAFARSEAGRELDAELFNNTAFGAAADAAGLAPDSSAFASADAQVNSARRNLDNRLEELATAENAVAALTSAEDIMAVAAVNQNAFIEGAATALVDPDAPVNYETQVLGALIDHEDRITANTADIADLDTRVTTNTADIADLDTRVTTTEAGILANTALIGVVDSDSKSRDAALGTRITGETTARVAADAALDNRITTVDGESRTRDTALSERIAREATTRAQADEALLARVTSETTARVAADTAINNRINGVEGRVGNLEGRVGVLEDKVDSSTAVAIAMGGTAFLPDMDFNLSANVATFNGAQAISAAFGARVSRNVAVSGAIGHGMNKDGDTGARVGFIFGF